MPCTAWLPGDGPAAQALDREQIERRTYDLDATHEGRFRRLAACARMAPGLFGLTRPLVHVHSPTVFGLLRPALLAVRARTVVHFHIEPSAEEIDWTLKSPPAHIVACAKYITKSIKAALDTRSISVPVTTVPNAVDLDRFIPGDVAGARSRLGLKTDSFVILMLGNLAPHKGQDTTLRAVDLLVRRGMTVECWLVGEDRTPGGQYERDLRSLCVDLDLIDRVRFLGFRQDAPELLQAADAFVLPSTHEGLPLSVLEAQAARVPVVGSTIPGILEVVEDGKTGFVVPADDFIGYADRLQTLFQNHALRNQLTEAAAAQVSREHSWSTLEDRVFEVYRSLILQRVSSV